MDQSLKNGVRVRSKNSADSKGYPLEPREIYLILRYKKQDEARLGLDLMFESMCHMFEALSSRYTHTYM